MHRHCSPCFACMWRDSRTPSRLFPPRGRAFLPKLLPTPHTALGGVALSGMRSPLGHNYSLDHASLRRSLVHLGDSSHFQHLHTSLKAGEPLTVGVIGASVAQNGGCIHQPGQRCMQFNGGVPVKLEWMNERRQHKGFAVRLVELLKAAWPRSQPTLVNAAQDATPAQNMLPCLFTHLPRNVGLVVVEFGSLALHLRLPAAEAIARKLLGLRPPPVVVFLTIRGLCKRSKEETPETIRYTLGSHWELYTRNESTAWSRAEAEFGRICVHYGLSCVSLYEAVIDQMLARRPGFSLRDVSIDCLHPSHGRFGTEYLTDLLANWLERGLGLRGERAGGGSHDEERWRTRGSATIEEAGSTPWPSALPEPLHMQNRQPAPDGVCYSFGKMRSKAKSAISQRMRNLDWSTAQCRSDGACEPLNHTVCPRSNTARSADPGFSYCQRALSGKGGKGGKVSPGALALLPGAQLEFAPDTRLLSGGTRADPQARLQAGLEYLISYESMGRAVLRCESRCSCREQRLDAHRTSTVHNESVFIRHFWQIRGATDTCRISLRVLSESSSGGHKFKVRSLFIAPGDSGAQRLWQRIDSPDGHGSS